MVHPKIFVALILVTKTLSLVFISILPFLDAYYFVQWSSIFINRVFCRVFCTIDKIEDDFRAAQP